MKENMIKRSYGRDVLEFAAKRYGTQPEYPRASQPGHAVLRHNDSQKRYGLMMNLPRERLGLDGLGEVDILEVKSDPMITGSLLSQPGILPGYYRHKGGWVAILLDGTVDKEQIFFSVGPELFFHLPPGKPKALQGHGQPRMADSSQPPLF